MSILHELGVVTVPYADLPDDLQKKYQADIEKANAELEKQTEDKKIAEAEKDRLAKIRDDQKIQAEKEKQAQVELKIKIQKEKERQTAAAVAPRETNTSFQTTGTYSSSSANGRTIHTGPRGGRYYINKNGNKTYVKR